MKLHPIFHVSLLETYHENTFPDRVQPPPPPVIVDDDTLEYEVEEILDSKIFRRRLRYLVRWKGYPDSDNSWEPAEFLANAPNLLNEFHRKYPSKPR